MLVTVASLLAGCGGDDAGGDFVSFRFANSPTALSLVRIADELGYWKDAGVRPEYVGPATTVPATQLLDQGKVDIATGMQSDNITAYSKGVKGFTLIASSMLDLPEEPHMSYFTKAGSPINKNNWKAIEGGKIGVSGFNSCTDLVIKRLLKDNGVDLNKVEFVELKNELVAPALDKGEIDLGVFHPPLIGVLLSQKEKFTQIATSFDDWGELGGQAPFKASNIWLKKNPEAAREFVGIIAKTANWANEHPKESAEIAGKTTGYPVEQTTNWHYAPNALLDKESLQLWWDLVEEVGEVTPTWREVTIEQMATNAYNPYAKTADLLVSQTQNKTIIRDTQNTGILDSPLVQK
ncbi:ABC-type nitrate/sulfonate/bicarbonate transport system substrate-binding protein [Actinoplanes lutulentus]|uniref:ABC-type nitrate/sulfonate/bicarbonate transport system substrate-binding protein n=1 Tax=Actinoplanes lutulentus TaxID=1287878 RepID=A0A327Z464_9ACTN|nr:ABC transporter substrate-binding protein [Actinoplanes lutulentus]MBB2946917.1 ABC-type nitrate/sulfonate/bicarbonate transport system substrate-binding protein [Actinoplanes lutulentus]RAK30420.1 ABC-type nitrate/sulfonate/bicarbonate transport system substrate-binding protein [Actinoplanes lutulentus]